MTIRWPAVLAITAFVVAPTTSVSGQTAQVIIQNDRLEPRVVEALTGERVSFVNRTGRAVHLQLPADVHQHEVFQVPVTGPISAVFHRPGTHPYIVHVYGRGTQALEGVVNVTLDETHQWEIGTCGVVVEGNCLEP